ncbi:hypothetical protein [Sphingopyxis sp. GC21]|uniref:hypothetical protein n=1 Tax=Sphingopyxis sp. GC21 TaxID=2933562 RepID=UPI0021E3FB41|nr:hypothetical protein [Sphingopyxis sp. GC21]
MDETVAENRNGQPAPFIPEIMVALPARMLSLLGLDHVANLVSHRVARAGETCPARKERAGHELARSLIVSRITVG